jgi:hypothetical protein
MAAARKVTPDDVDAAPPAKRRDDADPREYLMGLLERSRLQGERRLRTPMGPTIAGPVVAVVLTGIGPVGDRCDKTRVCLIDPTVYITDVIQMNAKFMQHMSPIWKRLMQQTTTCVPDVMPHLADIVAQTTNPYYTHTDLRRLARAEQSVAPCDPADPTAFSADHLRRAVLVDVYTASLLNDNLFIVVGNVFVGIMARVERIIDLDA